MRNKKKKKKIGKNLEELKMEHTEKMNEIYKMQELNEKKIMEIMNVIKQESKKK